MYELNDIVTLKKAHPCGGKEWEIARVSADVKLKCLTCGRFVNVSRDELKKRAKNIVSKSGEERNV